MAKKIIFWIGIAVTAVCLFFVFKGIKYGMLWQIIKHIKVWLLLLTVAIYISGYFIRSVRWHYLLKHIKSFSAFTLFPYLVIGFMFNNVLPARAGEFIRAYLTGSKLKVSGTSAFATVVIERVFDGLVMIFYFIIGYTAFHFIHNQTQIAPVTFFGMSLGIKDAVLGFAVLGSAVFLGIFVFMFFLLFKKDATVGFVHKIMSVFPAGIRDRVGKFIDLFILGLGVLGNAGDMLTVFGLSVFAWSVEAFTYWLMGAAMNIHVNFLLVCLIMAVANFAIMVPSTSGGVGPFEFFGVGIMLLFSYTKEQAAAYVFIVHAMILFPIIILGAFFMAGEGMDFSKIVNEQKKEEVK
jgi:uncharacterized protein (TIRG00374 family)